VCSSDLRNFDEIFTVQDVIEEVRDKISKMKLSSLNPKIIEPSIEAVKSIKQIAGETGDLEKLSETDIKVLAVAKENQLMIISDDRNIQNVAEKLGIKYISVFSKQITKSIKWRKYCENCKKTYEKGDQCKICGGKLKRVPVESKTILF
jgi:UPF0271 protein